MKKIIKKSLRDVIGYKIFDIKYWFSNKEKSLFDIIKNGDIEKIREKIFKTIYNRVSSNIKKWVVLHLIFKLQVKSFNLGFDGISIIESSDKKMWEQISNKFPDIKYWNPLTGNHSEEDRNLKKTPKAWIVCEVYGAKSSIKEKAKFLIRKFLGILFSHLAIKNSKILKKSDGNSVSYPFLFPEDGGMHRNYIGKLMYPLLNSISVSEDILTEVSDWYKMSSIFKNKEDKAFKGAYFIQHALISNGIERFIHFFIAIDALFGEEGSNRNAIIKGTKKVLHKDKIWNKEKVEDLYDLRCELVHGGSISIEKGRKEVNYNQDSKPLSDVRKFAMKSLCNYFRDGQFYIKFNKKFVY